MKKKGVSVLGLEVEIDGVKHNLSAENARELRDKLNEFFGEKPYVPITPIYPDYPITPWYPDYPTGPWYYGNTWTDSAPSGSVKLGGPFDVSGGDWFEVVGKSG